MLLNMKKLRPIDLKHRPGGGGKGRERYHHGDLRTALVAAGRELLAENGLKGFTLRECARRAGVSHAAPAHHFPTAGDLLAEIAAAGFDDLTASMRHFAAAAPPGDAAGHLIGLGRGYVAFALANRAAFQLMFRREAFAFQNERFAAAARQAFACLELAVEALLPHGTPEERGLAVERAWSLVHGYATLVIEGQIGKGETDPEVLNARLAAMLTTELGK
jgi:AcrR family transcriptional regulator